MLTCCWVSALRPLRCWHLRGALFNHSTMVDGLPCTMETWRMVTVLSVTVPLPHGCIIPPGNRDGWPVLSSLNLLKKIDRKILHDWAHREAKAKLNFHVGNCVLYTLWKPHFLVGCSLTIQDTKHFWVFNIIFYI